MADKHSKPQIRAAAIRTTITSLFEIQILNVGHIKRHNTEVKTFEIISVNASVLFTNVG